ncbi:MAG: GNAT family N-acetyltransferase [Clostridiales bacterium]|nr:GNAT family N-acetyltransferase [Clostridiales bacterium]
MSVSGNIWGYLGELHRNGQIHKDITLIYNDNSLQAFFFMPELDSLDEKNSSSYVVKGLMVISKDYAITSEILGRNAVVNEVYSCKNSSWYILYTHRDYTISPIVCGDCLKAIPVYKLPYIDFPKNCQHELGWQWDYELIDELWFHIIKQGRGKMNIRKAILADVKTISTMYEDFYAFHAQLQLDYYRETQETGKYPEETIKSEDGDIIIAEIDNDIVGFVHVKEEKTLPYACIVPHRFALCVDLFVLPIYRKKGIGTALLNAVKEWAKKRDLDYVELRVLPENENASRLYLEEGFQKVLYTMRCLFNDC